MCFIRLGNLARLWSDPRARKVISTLSLIPYRLLMIQKLIPNVGCDMKMVCCQEITLAYSLPKASLSNALPTGFVRSHAASYLCDFQQQVSASVLNKRVSRTSSRSLLIFFSLSLSLNLCGCHKMFKFLSTHIIKKNKTKNNLSSLPDMSDKLYVCLKFFQNIYITDFDCPKSFHHSLCKSTSLLPQGSFFSYLFTSFLGFTAIR